MFAHGWTDRVLFRGGGGAQRAALEPNQPESAADVRVSGFCGVGGSVASVALCACVVTTSLSVCGVGGCCKELGQGAHVGLKHKSKLTHCLLLPCAATPAATAAAIRCRH